MVTANVCTLHPRELKQSCTMQGYGCSGRMRAVSVKMARYAHPITGSSKLVQPSPVAMDHKYGCYLK
eukprot:10101136-Karenia_brevis.AAC.1